MAGVVLGLKVAFSAYATFATNDYLPILIAGTWQAGLAFVALHVSAVTARGSRARIAGLVAAMLVLIPFSDP